MAAALEKEKTDTNWILRCTICSKELKKPKLLPCQHSFCTQCLVQSYSEVDEEKTFCCPTCHQKVELEDNDIETLPDNYLFGIVKEATGASSIELKCSPCNEGGKVTTATHKCLDCGDIMCQHCSEWHCKFLATKHHVIVTLSDLKEGRFQKDFSERKVLYCNLHSTDEQKVPLSSYCDKCRCLVCVECTQDVHKQHSFSKKQSVRKTQQRELSAQLTNLDMSHKDQKKRTENIEKAITDTKQKWSQQEKEVYDTATELYAVVDKIKDEKLSELKKHYEKELQDLNELLQEEQNKWSSLKASVAFTDMFLEKCSDSDFLYHENDVMSRMEASQKGLSKSYKRNIVTVDKGNTESILHAVGDVFGDIKTRKNKFLHKCRLGIVQEELRKKIDKKTNVCGLAYDTTKRDILITGFGNFENVIVETEYYQYGINSRGADASFDIDLKESDIVLSIYKEDSRKIVVIDRFGTIMKSFMLPEDDQKSNGPLGILVDGNIVFIASYTMDRIYKLYLDDDILSIFISTGDLNSPSYLCISTKGDLIVSNTGSSNIQGYSKEGELQWLYNGYEEGNPLCIPKGVCCDEDGYIYVVDLGNCRIQVIRDKKLIGTIPIDQEAKDEPGAPIISTPDGGLVYGYKDNLIKISFWQ